MSAEQDIINAIQTIAAEVATDISVLCTVVDVDKDTHTCTCSPVNGEADFRSVRLKSAVVASPVGIIIYPEVGSEVMVSVVDQNDANAFVAKYGAVESVSVDISSLFTLFVDASGLHTQGDTFKVIGTLVELGEENGEFAVLGESLKTWLTDQTTHLKTAATALKNFAAMNKAAASGVLAPLQAGYAALEIAMLQLESDLNGDLTAIDSILAAKVKVK